MLQPVKNFLKRHLQTVPLPLKKKEAIQTVIRECFGVEIEKKNISLTPVAAHLRLSPKIKSEILLRQEEVLSRLKDILGADTPAEIN